MGDSTNLKKIESLVHGFEGAIASSEHAFNQILLGTKSVDAYKKLHEQAIEQIRTIRLEIKKSIESLIAANSNNQGDL